MLPILQLELPTKNQMQQAEKLLELEIAVQCSFKKKASKFHNWTRDMISLAVGHSREEQLIWKLQLAIAYPTQEHSNNFSKKSWLKFE